MESIDITLLAGSRPGLLDKTLQSFNLYVFKHIRIGEVFVNIDPHGGTEIDRQECISTVLKYFPKAIISTPESSSFGLAVKFLWSLPQTRCFLHLEDDWVVTRDIRLDLSDFREDSRVKQWYLVKPRVEQSFITSYRFRPLGGVPFFLPNLGRPAFTTSPSVIDSRFAREVSELMNEALNPEKQMFNGLNPLLEDHLKGYRSKAMLSWWERPFMHDIGREWQRTRGIQVEIVDGIHVYKKLNEQN